MDEETTSSSSNKSSGRGKKILLVLVALLIIGGVAAYFINKNNEEDSKATTSSSQPANNQQSSANTFDPAATADQPYVATIKTTASGKEINGVMQSDGNGTYSYAYSAEGKNVTLYYTPTAYYLCSGTDTCIKYPISQSSTSGFDPSAYQYDGTKLENLKNTAAYKGQQACPAGGGTCDVWTVTVGGATSTMYINSSSKKIAKVTSATGTTSSEITYDYKNVSIAVPANAQSLPTTQ